MMQASFSACQCLRLTLASSPSCASTFWWAWLVSSRAWLPCSVENAEAVIRRPERSYYWCLAVLVASATGLSVVRWAENHHLFTLGILSLIAATVGRTALRQRWRSWVKVHITGMGLSYILMLTAFYVDNGKNLPLWRELPQIAFWLLPAAIGIPLIVRALVKHPLARSRLTK